MDPWLEMISKDGDKNQSNSRVEVVYGLRKPKEKTRTELERSVTSRKVGIWTSWNRSLSIRGRESIAITAPIDFHFQTKPEPIPKPKPKPKEPSRRPPKPASKKNESIWQVDLSKEKKYFDEIDATELLVESPSPEKTTWVAGAKEEIVDPDLPAILARWKLSDLPPASPLFEITETPSSCSFSVETLRKAETPSSSFCASSYMSNKSFAASLDRLQKGGETVGSHVAQRGPSIKGETCFNAFTRLLMACNQTEPVSLHEVILTYSNEPSSIKKLGEGTYGEAFRVGPTVFKIVPIDGNTLVNGEIQKKSEEVLEEVLLSVTLNNLRVEGNNSCTGFIESKEFKVCKGAYDCALIKAWDKWDAEHASENDHPKDFTQDQCYIVFVLADGGRDLEGFILSNYNEARSLLLQVSAFLAVAESACEFEHRDLHWGNILLSRNGRENMSFVLDGERKKALTFGLTISIIDFTLSRINTGKDILFLDLSVDPALFEGPKGDKQSETYRKMKQVTRDCWSGSFPETNVLWLVYLVDILLLKKSFKRTAKDERELRSFKKRLNSYKCSKDCLADPFFDDILVAL